MQRTYALSENELSIGKPVFLVQVLSFIELKVLLQLLIFHGPNISPFPVSSCQLINSRYFRLIFLFLVNVEQKTGEGVLGSLFSLGR